MKQLTEYQITELVASELNALLTEENDNGWKEFSGDWGEFYAYLGLNFRNLVAKLNADGSVLECKVEGWEVRCFPRYAQWSDDIVQGYRIVVNKRMDVLDDFRYNAKSMGRDIRKVYALDVHFDTYIWQDAYDDTQWEGSMRCTFYMDDPEDFYQKYLDDQVLDRADVGEAV